MYISKDLVRKFYKIGIYFIILLVILDLIAYFYYPHTAFGKIFLATREQTPLTWFSAISFFIVGCVCACAYERTKERVMYYLALVYLFFSIDDATYIHERFTGSLVDSTTIFNNFPTYIWIVVYFPLLIFALVGFTHYLWARSSQHTKKMIITSTILLFIAIVLDLADGYMGKNESLVMCMDEWCHESAVHMMRLIEEVCEVFAFGVLGYLGIKKESHLTSQKKK